MSIGKIFAIVGLAVVALLVVLSALHVLPNLPDWAFLAGLALAYTATLFDNK